MTYLIIAISFLSLLGVILLYNILLGLFKKGFRTDILQKISLSVLITSSLSSGMGFFYNKIISNIGFDLSYPPKFETLHSIIENLYPLILFLAPVFALILLFSINNNWKKSHYMASLAIISEIAVLIATIII